MKKFLRLLRLEYSTSWLMIYFAGLIYLKSIYFTDRFDIFFIIAALILTISVNVHNDLCDGKSRGYRKNFLKFVIMISLVLGLVIFPNLFLVLAVLITYIYNWKLKKIPYLSLPPLVAPGLAIMMILNIYDPLPIAIVIFASIAVHSGHQLIDGDIRNKNYFYIYIFSSFISFLLISLVLFSINVALSWLAFMLAIFSGFSIFRIKDVNKAIKRLEATKKQRASIIANYWIILIFLIGWYLLI